MLSWLWPLVVILGGTFLLINLIAALRRIRSVSVVSANYPGGIEFCGHRARGRTTFPIVQWLSDPADPRPCPLVVHLPAGDLGGEALCQWDSLGTANKMGCPEELDIFPFHKDAKVIGVSLRLIPGGWPVAVSVAGKRLELPAPEEEVVRLLGEPT
jgi:hypothetical protein